MRKLIQLVAALIVTWPFTVNATLADPSFPNRPITMVVPFSAGGAVDTVGRLIGEQLSKSLGQPIIVENVTGAGGTIAATRVARAPANGYTILLGNLGTQVASVGNFKNLPYDPRKDFTPVMIVANAPEVLLVEKNASTKTLQEFIAYAKAKDKPLTIGHAGVGSISHLTILLFRKLTGISLVPVPYRGDIDANKDVIGGQLDSVFNWTILAAPAVNSGQMKALAVLSPRRSVVIPDVPTSGEAGMPDLLVNAWTALFFPKGTPEPIVSRVTAALQKVFTDESVVKRMNTIGIDVPTADQRTPEALDQLVNSEFEKWLPIIEQSH